MRLPLECDCRASHVGRRRLGLVANVDGAEVLLESFAPEEVGMLEVFIGEVHVEGNCIERPGAGLCLLFLCACPVMCSGVLVIERGGF